MEAPPPDTHGTQGTETAQPEADDPTLSGAVREALHRALDVDAKTREPMNALVVWTELGKGLAGTLSAVGGELGVLRRIVFTYCNDHGTAAEVDLSRWAYRVEPDARLTQDDAAVALQRAEGALEDVLEHRLKDAGRIPEARRALFITVARGWFAAGVDIFKAMPAARDASQADVLGALGAWSARYLPESDPQAPDAPAPLFTREARDECDEGQPTRIRLRTL